MANSSNGASSTIRNIPDVAAEGNFDNYLCDQGSCQGTWGGTSFAAPRWAGFLALINQQAVANGSSTLGFINPAVYSIGKGTSYNSDFHDITSGNNNNGKGKSYNAVVGYDLVTGWGSPNGASLINALAGSATPSFYAFGFAQQRDHQPGWRGRDQHCHGYGCGRIQRQRDAGCVRTYRAA